MNNFKKIYNVFCKIEEGIANILLVSICSLVFLSAVARTIHHPLNWAVDISLLFFAWEVFLGGDISIRNTNLIGIEILSDKFPPLIQKSLKFFFSIFIVAFLALLVRFGISLCFESSKRLFQVLPISYSWCTLSVPVGAFFMIISTIVRLFEVIKMPVSCWERKRTVN